MSDQILDLRGLKCPLPVLRTRKALARMAPGTMLWVQCTDPLAVIDLPLLLRQTGDVLVACEDADSHRVFAIRKAGGRDPAPTPQAE